jgi:predicted glutamine amidotransferase
MNCAALTDFNFSFRGFARRGGDTDIHSHGWGLCFYDGRGLRAFHDREAAAESLLAEFLQMHPVKTLNMVAHIRYATRGEVKLENVHPFQREMWGISFCFAHNGDVSAFDRKQFAGNDADCPSLPPKVNQMNKSCVKIPWIGTSIGVEDTGERCYNPIGATDSEAMFCAILNALRARFDTLPTLPVLHKAVASLCNEIVTSDDQNEGTTILNFLLGCGPHLQFAYSWPGAREGSSVWNGLHYLVREPPFTTAHLSDCDYSINFATCTKEDDRVAVIATSPLTDDEDWVEIKMGELILFDDGLPHMAPDDCVDVELRKHGLESDVIPASPSLEVDMRRYQLRSDFFQGTGI